MSKEYHEYSELSQAAYSTLNSGFTVDYDEALETSDFTGAQFTSFAQRFPEIITQVTDPTTGFSATVFRDNEIDNNLILAFRGTGPDVFSDLFPTDFHIGLVGAGFDQITDMYNCWMRESSASNVEVAQYRINYYESAASKSA